MVNSAMEAAAHRAERYRRRECAYEPVSQAILHDCDLCESGR